MVRAILGAVGVFLVSATAWGHQGHSAELAALDAELRARPADVGALVRRAAVHRRQRAFSRAIADLERALRLDPRRADLYLERGLTRAASGDAAGADVDFTRALAGSSEAPRLAAAALAGRAVSRERLGRLEAARADYDAAIRSRPDPELVLARGRIDEARGRLDLAADGYAEGLRALGGAVVIRIALVRVERRRKNFERALALVDEVLAVAPLKADLRLVRAEVLADAGRSSDAERERLEALREIDSAIASKPNDLRRLTRARAYLALRRIPDARAELEGILSRSPKLTEAEALLAEARRPGGHR
jgi:tetratricopeptide (TPR) repeat protein